MVSIVRENFSGMVRDPHKVVTVGDVGVGKTSLVLRIATNQFHEALPTAGLDYVTKTVDTGQENAGKVEMNFWDTAGEEKFKDTLSNAYFRHARAAIFVYSLVEDHTLTFIDKWVEDAIVYSPNDIVFFLCGSMKDELPEEDCEAHRKMKLQASFLKERYNMADAFETSSKTGEGVKEMCRAIALRLGRPRLVERRKLRSDDEKEKEGCLCH